MCISCFLYFFLLFSFIMFLFIFQDETAKSLILFFYWLLDLHHAAGLLPDLQNCHCEVQVGNLKYFIQYNNFALKKNTQNDFKMILTLFNNCFLTDCGQHDTNVCACNYSLTISIIFQIWKCCISHLLQQHKFLKKYQQFFRISINITAILVVIR